MKILVADKQVIGRDTPLKVNAAQTWVDDEDDPTFEINEPDAYALEAALQLKEKHGGEVVALCAGPARAAKTIREALAKGADRGIHIELPNVRRSRHSWHAPLLAKAAEAEKADLILTGLQSDDLGYGQTGVIMAELMGLPHATIIMEVEVPRFQLSRQTRTRRRLVPARGDAAPAVLTIQSGISQAPLRHIDGDQEGQIQRDQAPGRRRRAWRA